MAENPSPTQVLFARAVIARLAVWPVLRIAVDSSWGGPESKEKRSWMAGEVIDAFLSSKTTSSEPDDTYIEELLLQMMADEFDCVVEDLSGEIVAKDVIKLWEDIKKGAIEESVKYWEEKEKALNGKKLDYAFSKKGDDTDWVDEEEEGSSEDDDGTEEEEELSNQMEVDENVPDLIDQGSKSEPVVDEDGFTLVQRKGKKTNKS
ncbi:hypothetical protein FRC15_007896 [Serendipita sp. 397]|nr:hypothetical protein FRC15_007896 [Serendipita sp. 397]